MRPNGCSTATVPPPIGHCRSRVPSPTSGGERPPRCSELTVGYLIALLTLSAAGVGLVIVLSGQSPGLRPLATAAVVGTALFVALLLMSFGVRLPVVAACLLALVADAALLRIATAEQIQAVTAAGLLLVLLTYALATLRRAQLHH